MSNLETLIPDHDKELFEKIPEHLRPGLTRYFVDRIEPGGFLRAVLENDLNEVIGRAKADITMKTIRSLVVYLWNCAPGNSYGDPNKVQAWLAGEVK